MGFFDSTIGKIAGGVLGDIIGGAATGAISSAYDADLMQLNAKLQRENWEYMQKNKHQLEVQDLEAAGLNKLLSATNGQAISAPSISGGNVNASSRLGQTAMQLAVEEKRAQIEKTRAETDRLRADIEKFSSNTERLLAMSNIDLNKANIGYIAAETGRSFAQTQEVLQNIQNSIKITAATVENLKSGTAMNYAQAQKFVEEAKLAIKNAESIGVDIQLKNADLNSWPRKLANLTAEQQYQFLQNNYGSVLNQTGYSLGLLLPFGAANFSAGDSGLRFGGYSK